MGKYRPIVIDRRRVKGDKPWHQLPALSGIYTITHVPTGLKYVGCALNIRHRCYSHSYELNRGRHHNPHLQARWIEDGASAFVFEVHSLHADVVTLEDAEEEVIAKLNTFSPNGFNMCKRAISALGRKWNDHQRSKMQKYPESVVKGWIADRKSGMTIREISDRDNVCLSYVAKRTRDYGFEVMSRTTIMNEMKKEFRKLYMSGLSATKIARKFGISKKSVFDSVRDILNAKHMHAEHARKKFTSHQKLTAAAMWLSGKPAREIAKKLDTTYLTIRSHFFAGKNVVRPKGDFRSHG